MNLVGINFWFSLYLRSYLAEKLTGIWNSESSTNFRNSYDAIKYPDVKRHCPYFSNYIMSSRIKVYTSGN